MADELISRQAVIRAMRTMPIPKQAINNDWFGAVTAGVNAAIKLVAEFPAVDAVEVGSCNGCIYSNRKRPQKCSCCRRNRDMKDCYRRGDDG